MSAQPLLKTNELMSEIRGFQDDLRKINIFDKRKLLAKLDSLSKLVSSGEIDECDIFDFQGMILCLANDAENAIASHKTALTKSPNNFEVRFNYFVTLFSLGYLKEANEIGEIMLSQFPTESTEFGILNRVISNLLVLGELHKANDYLNCSANPTDYSQYETVINGLEIFNASNLSDNEAEKIHECIFDILHEKKLYLSTVETSIVDGCLLHRLYVDLRIEDIFEVNWDAAGILAENVENMRSDVVMFEFNSVDILLERRGDL